MQFDRGGATWRRTTVHAWGGRAAVPVLVLTSIAAVAAPPASAAIALTAMPITAVEGQISAPTPVAEFTDPLALAPSNYAATIDWGDRTITTGTVVAANTRGAYEVIGSPAYVDEGSYTVKVSVSGPRSEAASGSAAATVNDAPIRAAGLELLPYATDPGVLASLYRDLLHRSPDPAGASAFLAQLQTESAGLRVSFALVIDGSNEYRLDRLAQVYQRLLRRAATPVEIASGLTALAGGMTDEQFEASIAAGGEFFAQAGGTNGGFVDLGYRRILGRPADAGAAAFVAALDSGASRSDIALAILTSDEARGDLVDALYNRLLHRPADPVGRAHGVSALDGGQTDEQYLAALVGSGEYFAVRAGASIDGFLDAVYGDLLSRPVDPAGRSLGEGFLRPSAAISQTVAAILGSAEYRARLVAGYYSAYLLRPAQPAEIAMDLNILGGGVTDEQLEALILGSPEYFTNRGGGTNDGFLTSIYGNLLGRTPTPDERAAGDQQLTGGTPAQQVAATILQSLEYRTRWVRNAYLTLLRRAPTQVEQDSAVLALQNGGTDEQIESRILDSDAYYFAASPPVRAEVEFDGRVAYFSDGNPTSLPAEFKAIIDWGDGATSPGVVESAAGGGFNVLGRHTYHAVGKQQPVTAIDDVGGSSASIGSTVSIVPIMAGDLNNDGIVDLTDLRRLMQLFIGLATPSAAELSAADVRPAIGVNGRARGDGALHADDLEAIFRIFLGLDLPPT